MALKAVLSFLLTGATACTLLDPLDDVSGGAPQGHRSSSSSSGAGTDASPTTSSSGSSSGGATCSQFEREPNDSAASANRIEGTDVSVCGFLPNGSDDVDQWSFENTTGNDLRILIEAKTNNGVTLTLQDGRSAKGPVGQLSSTLGPNETLTLTIGASSVVTEDLGYWVHFTAN